MRRIAPALFPALVFGLLFFAGTDAKAQESEADVIAASKTVGLGDNPYHEALVLKHIKQIHQLRSEGRISAADYQRLMAWHQIENLSSARRAAASLGLEVVPQSVDPSKGEYRDGSDSDYHVRRKDGTPLTLEDVQAVERAYRQQVNQEVRTRSKAGGTPLAPSTQTFDTATDFMAAVTGTTEGEFNRIAKYFEAKGADTYSRYGAAVVESQLRSPGSTVDIRAGGMYVNEMIDQAAKKQAKIDKVREQIGTATGAEAQRLQGQLDVLIVERDKYIDRINQVNNKLSDQAGLKRPPGVSPDSDWRNAGRAQYAQTLGNIAASSPESSDMRRYSRFILALQIADMPENQRRAHLEWLDPTLRREVEAQVQQFQEQEQVRVSADRVARLQRFLGQTETGRKLMAAYDWVFDELTRERSRVTQSSQFIGDVLGDVSATSQQVGNRAMQLSMWLDVMKQVSVSQSDADLAIALGRTLASNTYVGMIASYAYTGLVEGDATALAKAMIILLCPQAALPQVVQSIGDSAIDLTATMLFDQQFLALYAAATFDPTSGALLSMGGYGGRSATCQFLDDVLSPGGYGYVEGVFTRALDLAKEKNLSVEMLSGANRAGAVALARAFQSTVYGGAPQVMKNDSRLLGACGEVAALTSTINDFVAGLGQPGTVSMDVDQNWTHPTLEPAAQSQLSKLLKLRSAAWPNVKKAVCDGIRENLETRHVAVAQLDKGDQELLDMLAKVERLFRDLEMYDLGMSWLNYDAGFNFINRTFFVSTKEQKLKRMEVLQKYFVAYSAVLQLRDSAEGTYVAYGGKRLTPRPLTGTPLMTADPAFDRATAGTLVQEVMNALSKLDDLLLFIKRDALNDDSVRLDADVDKRILGGLFSTILIGTNNEAVIKGVAHSRSRLYKVQILSQDLHLSQEDLRANTEDAYGNISVQATRSKNLIEEFKEYYKKRDPSLAILPPPAVREQRAAADTEYAFRLAASNVPAEAVWTWHDDAREIGKGPILQHAFPAAGVYRLSATASWVKSERVKREGTVTAELRCVIGEPGSDVGKKPALSIVLPRELAAGPGVAGKVYPFGVNATSIPPSAVYAWSRGLDPLKTGKSVELSFAEDGAVNLSVSAAWVVEGSGAAEEVWARASFKVVNPPLDTPGGVTVRIDGKTSASVSEDIQLKAVVETKTPPLPQVRFVWTHGPTNLGETDTVVFRQAQTGTYMVKVEVLTRIGAAWVTTAESSTAISVGRATVTEKPPVDATKPGEATPVDVKKAGEKPLADAQKPAEKLSAEKPPVDAKKPADARPGDKAPTATPTPVPTPVQDRPADDSVVTFGGTVPGIWDGGNNPSGFDFKRQVARTTGTGDCKWEAEVQSNIAGRIDPSGSANTPEAITERVNDVVAASKARWGATAVVRPFAIGDFKGQFVDTSVVFLPGGWSDGGFRADGVIAGGRGWLIKGRHTVEIAYSVAGSGCWTNVDRAFLEGQANAAQADAKAIVASLTLVEKGSFARVPYRGPKLDGSDMPRVTLSPPALEKLKVGDTVSVSAIVENASAEDRPVRYTWAGEFEGKPGTSTDKATVTIRPKKGGTYPLSVSVDGARYNLGSASLAYEVADLKAEITLQSPAAKRVAIGGPVTFSARLLSSGVPITGNFVYRWQPTPEVAFKPGEGPASQATAVFSRPGVTRVWVQILEKKGTVLTTLAESDQLDIEVVKPEFSLSVFPAEPYPGQEVRITASETPAVGDAFMTYWWEYAGSAINPGAEANPRVYSFRPKDTTPVTVTAHARATDGGDDLGTRAVVVRARPHTVQVTGPIARGPKPQVWSAQAGRLVDVEQQFAVFQDVSMRASVTPAPVNQPLHYQWTVSPDGCAISNPASQEPTFNCAQTGTVAALVTVRDSLGATLGTGTGTIPVSISQASLQQSRARADAARQAAAQATQQAQAAQQAKLDAEKQAAALAAKLERAAQQTKLDAEKKALAEADQRLMDELARHVTAERLRAEGQALQQQGKLREAMAKYRESLTYVADPAMETFIAQVEAMAVKQEQAAQLAAAQATQQAQAAQQATIDAERKAAAEAAQQGKLKSPPAATSATGTSVVVYKNTNIGGVYNSPSAPTQFTIATPHVISYVFTYHWNDQRGSAQAGTIGLRHSNGTLYGPWAATGTPGQGGVPNAGWEVRPNVVIPAGTYTIVDSSPSTWAQNGESGGRGHAIVEGRPAGVSTASAPAVADRVPATGAWVLEKTEFVVQKFDPEFMQKFQPLESGEDGAGSAESTIGLLRSRMRVVWTSPPRVLIPGKAIDIRMTISDAGSSPERLVWGSGGVGANCPALSAVWYGPAVGITSKPGEGTPEASKAYTPPSAPPGTTMYIAAEWSVGSRRNTFYYLYKFMLDAGQALAPVSAASSPSVKPQVDADRLGHEWTVTEAVTFTGRWVRRGDSDVWDASWNNGAVAILTISIAGANVRISRRDVGGPAIGLTGIYEGTLAADGTLQGTETVTWPGHFTNQVQSWYGRIVK